MTSKILRLSGLVFIVALLIVPAGSTAAQALRPREQPVSGPIVRSTPASGSGVSWARSFPTITDPSKIADGSLPAVPENQRG